MVVTESAVSGSAVSRRAVAGLARALRDLTRLVVPVECAGCGQPDVRWCDACLARWTNPARRCEQAAPRLDRLDGRRTLPVWCLTDYGGSAREVVLAWKNRGRADLSRELGGALAASARGVALRLRAAGVERSVAVVPAPSPRASRRRRGREPVRDLAGHVAAGLVAGGCAAHVVPALRQRGAGRDQVGLGARQRAENLRDALTTTRHANALLVGSPVVLVDDVLTTGATLAACEDTLTRAGALVVAALVLGATPAPTDGVSIGRVGGLDGIRSELVRRSSVGPRPTGLA